ncbi:sensor domain-containing diguanylate cyclase [Candidatus Halocynthiibacter alkanivorans]|uniref:sensor domain-containing diguanylate cyclase n=1 Tax=Candidatus Halocynthiibacter alkanivorans TaxID=2267619 RepID=UPI001F31C466|nr:sensor domain-containing diguanylate cyclase [Candidatus Halocynthiibacter alkanivorans]
MKTSVHTLITSRLKSATLVLVFMAVAASSWWVVNFVPEELTDRMLATDIRLRSEQWKRRVLVQIASGSEAFVNGELSERDISFLTDITSTSDIYRYKLYRADGQVFWSSRASDIGQINTKDYFVNMVATGRVYQKHVDLPMSEIDGMNFHDASMMADMEHAVFEIYEPVMQDGQFVGAIEFYTDVTRLHETFVDRLQTGLFIIATVVLTLLGLFTVITLQSGRWQVNQLKQRALKDRVWRAKEARIAREVKLLGELNEWLQSSRSLTELFDMVSRFMAHILPGIEGTIYVYSNSRDVLDGCASWNGGVHLDHIHPESCWGLRRGRSYVFGLSEVDFTCEHAEPHDQNPYFCFPILAHGEAVGLMHLKAGRMITDDEFQQTRKLAQMCAEQISMAIANVQMRDQLQDQSVRDSLTGLFNRRHLTDSMRKLILRAQKDARPLSVVAVDVDHFKKFNDNHGHDAGDMVLRAVGAALEAACDGDEVACRSGGEEFMLLLPDLSPDEAFERAEALRLAVENITVRYGDKTLPRITISAGLSSYPQHGTMPQDLMRSADDALYAAKGKGRNQVAWANNQPPEPPITEPEMTTPKMADTTETSGIALHGLEPDPFRQGPTAPETDDREAG